MEMSVFKTIGDIIKTVSREKTADNAIKNSLKIITSQLNIDYAILWYFSKEDNLIHPYYWICPFDLTSVSYEPGESDIGTCYKDKKPVIHVDFSGNLDEKLKNIFGETKISSVICTSFNSEDIGDGCISYFKVNEKINEEDAEVCQILTLYIEEAIKEQIPSKNWEQKTLLMNVNNITKEFKNGDMVTKVLKGINFDVFNGEFLCFLGESGCGKSTLLNIIGGMDSPTSGSFTFKGVDYSKANEKELTKYRKDNIGFIFQNYNLMPNLTAKQNLDLIGELVENPMNSEELLELVNLSDKANLYPSQLSGGQQQRVSIARALAKNPAIIMADEPTAALDYETSIEVLTALENVVQKGTTLIMVTHNEEITKMANRVIRFRNGKIYEVTINSNPSKAKDLVW